MVFDPDFKIMKVKLNNSGIWVRDRHTWLSFLGFFEAFQGMSPKLEIFRNCYAATKLLADHFKIGNSRIYSFVDTGNDNVLFLMRNIP